jgi:hypothetical protein
MYEWRLQAKLATSIPSTIGEQRSTFVTHAAAKKAGLGRVRQPTSVIPGLSGGCTTVDSYYVVPVVDGNDKVRSVKAMAVDHIATLAAKDMPTNIKRRFPQAKGFE